MLEFREQNFDNSVNVRIYWEGEQMMERLSRRRDSLSWRNLLSHSHR